jgi:predicted dehydrogenase
LEEIKDVNFVAIVDPLTDKASKILQDKLAGDHASLYKDCKVYPDITSALQEKTIHIAFIGLPPACHGSFEDGKNIELELLRAGIHIFVEKPISVLLPEQLKEYVAAVTREAEERKCIVSVGYMFRYHAAVERVKEELNKWGRPLLAMNLRYNAAYANMTKKFWWDKTHSGGPIVEQCTHFCDLIRYFGGEVQLDTLKGYSVPTSIGNSDPNHVGYLASMPEVVKEANIPKENLSPCATQCVWKFINGGIGAMTHTASLHDHQYETALDIWCDGLRISLCNIYLPSCTLKIRKSGSIEDTVEVFPSVDPYLEEDKIFLKAVSSGDAGLVRSSYEDAAKTYELSWAITRATTSN